MIPIMLISRCHSCGHHEQAHTRTPYMNGDCSLCYTDSDRGRLEPCNFFKAPSRRYKERPIQFELVQREYIDEAKRRSIDTARRIW